MTNLNVATSHASRILHIVQNGLQPAGIEPHVTRSWYRCLREYRIEPSAPRQNAVLNSQSLKELQQRMGELLPVARAEMESLYEQIAGSGFAVILSDTQGVVLTTITDPALQREFRQAGLSLGALWDERHEGTNGIGTCLAEGCPVTVHREEHFRGYNLSLSCSGAPILDPHGSIIAVLDASTANSSDSRLIQRHTMALVNMSAHLISRWNFLKEFSQSWILRFHSRPEFVGLLHEALVAINGGGTILAVNESALLQLGCSTRKALVGEPIERFFQFDFATLERRAQFEPSTIWPVRDLAHGRRFFAIARAPLRPAGRTLELAAPSPAAAIDAGIQQGRGKNHVGEDAQMRKNLSFGRQLFAKQVPILLQGATGTGKEAFAKALHHSGMWADKAFVTVNCAAIPESLIESELFGYTRGAFTGAVKEGRSGKILQSNGGTLFLDEIGDMPLMLQTRLLRVIEEREVVPLGSDLAIPVILHVISATHRDIRKMIEDGEFREDLYYRLNGITLHLPLLRDRSDKADLIRTLLQEENAGQESIEIAEDAFHKLLDYSWPGNIRQLRNALRTASALCRDGIIRLPNLPQEILHTEMRAIASPSIAGHAELTSAALNPPSAALRDAECAALLRELERMHWNISRTAQALGISRNTLYRKIHKHNIVLEQ
ncbi:MAG TPA: sigma-54-dependent Fis family transcriptional regulator [Steroidobacteraceae bacterium]|jgi:transcriptional regulator of acetoin/glycerol metabolism|nr:sigma-54-dependent Fis family transcriptional regulator [Steroidobacteraceae bacterium]